MNAFAGQGAVRAEHDIASPEAAWQAGAQAMAIGDAGAALRWVQRAARLAPADPRIALDLANIQLQSGGPARLAEAAAAFTRLATEHDILAAWLGLLAARRLQGARDEAARALATLLSRHCVPEEPEFRQLASAVARDAGHPGWCGIDAHGRLRYAADGPVEARAADAEIAVVDGMAAPQARQIILRHEAAALLGSPLDPAVFGRCEGLVEAAGGTLAGWARLPAAPSIPPVLTLEDATGKRRALRTGEKLPADSDAPLTPRYVFRCSLATLQKLDPPLRLFGPDGAELLGSPADPLAELAETAIPAAYLGPKITALPPRAGLRVVVPVYRGLMETESCLTAALAALPPGAELIVVDDASPEPALADWLDALAGREARVRLLRHARNQGFAAAANTGLEAAAGCDVLLLNSDTLLPPGALQTLLAALYARAEIGSATPFSNDATICGYPRAERNPAPDLAAATTLDALAARSNGDEGVEIPTGVGFCLLMRHDCIARTGRFRPALFAQGYGEEVDWCLRARHRGFRHVAVPGAYVAHLGQVSFKSAGQALKRRNARLLQRLYPGYDQLIDAHVSADPLRAARRRLDEARFAAGRQPEAMLLISHSHGGGVARRVTAEMRDIRQAGRRPILLCPALQDGPAEGYAPAALKDDGAEDFPNLRYELPCEAEALLALLRAEQVRQVVWHHGLGHHPWVRRIAALLGCPQDIVVHDYASFCPRVHLIGANRRYCGEPGADSCAACIASAGDETREGLSPTALRSRSAEEFATARRVVAPSADASRRIARHFPNVSPQVMPWEDDRQERPLHPPRMGFRRILLLGGIGYAKGYDVLLECASDAGARDLPLDFVLAGVSVDDARLLQTGRVFITGYYPPETLPDLLASLSADLAFIPSIWPETWCFTLGEAWSAGLYTLAFDLGAQAERIRATGRGGLLPLGLPASRINDALLTWRPN